MTTFPWYEEVKPDTPVTQGDLIESCPVLVFGPISKMVPPLQTDAVLSALKDSHGFELLRVIVTTQACDLAQGKARFVTLCPVDHITEYKKDWEAAVRAERKSPKPDDWKNKLKQIQDGRILNLCLLNEWNGPNPESISIPYQIVDFQEVLGLPLDFLTNWVPRTETGCDYCPPIGNMFLKLSPDSSCV